MTKKLSVVFVWVFALYLWGTILYKPEIVFAFQEPTIDGCPVTSPYFPLPSWNLEKFKSPRVIRAHACYDGTNDKLLLRHIEHTDWNEDVSRAAPEAGQLRTYAKTGVGFCWKNSAGVETCPTGGASVVTSRTTVTNCATTGCEIIVTWAIAFADTNYTIVGCVIEDATAQDEVTGLRLAHVREKTATQIKVDLDNFSGVTVSGTLHCSAAHD